MMRTKPYVNEGRHHYLSKIRIPLSMYKVASLKGLYYRQVDLIDNIILITFYRVRHIIVLNDGFHPFLTYKIILRYQVFCLIYFLFEIIVSFTIKMSIFKKINSKFYNIYTPLTVSINYNTTSPLSLALYRDVVV